MTLLLEAKNVCKRFTNPHPITVLDNICLELEYGASIAIVGKSGSGKSTLLHILGALDLPSSGSITIANQNVLTKHNTIRKDLIGFVFQSFHLLEDYTLLENILMPAKIARQDTNSNSFSYRRALELIDIMDLTSLLHASVKVLSGGEKQRAAIARALIRDPLLLLVDEPTGNLDPSNAKIVQKLLLDTRKYLKKSLLLVTHDEEFATSCDQIFLLQEGRLIPHGN